MSKYIKLCDKCNCVQFVLAAGGRRAYRPLFNCYARRRPKIESDCKCREAGAGHWQRGAMRDCFDSHYLLQAFWYFVTWPYHQNRLELSGHLMFCLTKCPWQLHLYIFLQLNCFFKSSQNKPWEFFNPKNIGQNWTFIQVTYFQYVHLKDVENRFHYRLTISAG